MIYEPSALLRRLNPCCAKALDAAAGLCQTRAHSEITLEHWLLKLLESGTSDIAIIMQHYGLDIDELWHNLLNYLDSLQHTIHHKPALSHSLMAVLQNAWLKASLDDQEEIIRSVHLIKALQELPHCLQDQKSWQLLTFSSVALKNLRSELDFKSEESPILQQHLESNIEAKKSTDSTESIENKQHEITPEDQKKQEQQRKHIERRQQKQNQEILARFTEDLTEKAREHKIDPIFGRDNEIRQMIDILSRRRKNNPILVGEPGVGKTALVEGLALRIAEGNVPDNLKDVTILSLDLGLLQAGAGVKGEFEQRLKNVISAVQQSLTPIFVFIDEAHTVIGAGNAAGGADAANLLKPALARGELRTIAATTWSEYKQYFEKDAALERRFQVVHINEPDDEIAILMLRGLKQRYAKYHGVYIQDEAIKTAVKLSRRYLTGRQLPDKAVDLLDTAAARIRINLDIFPESITAFNVKLNTLETEKRELEADKRHGIEVNLDRLVEIEDQIQQTQQQRQEQTTQFEQERQAIQDLIELRSQLELTQENQKELLDDIASKQQALNNLQTTAALITLDVDSKAVASVIANWTGIPLESLLKNEQSYLLQLETTLSQRVVGQDNALCDIAKRIRASKTGLASENSPIGVFLLVGSSGVGKTECALALADTLFGGEQALITINMSEYQEAHTVSQLKGSPPGYVGYGQGGILTEAVRKRPYSVVLLDEVEKAHRDVLNLFYQVFDRGFMRDGEGREIDFRNTVILMTSNLGSDELIALFDLEQNPSVSKQQELLRPIIRDHFQPALLARFQTVIFTPLSQESLKQIIVKKFAQVSSRIYTNYGINFEVSSALFDYIVSACLLPDTGARNIDALLDQQILPTVSSLLLQSNIQKGNTLHLDFNDEEGISLYLETV